jgi:hypothetical protein
MPDPAPVDIAADAASRAAEEAAHASTAAAEVVAATARGAAPADVSQVAREAKEHADAAHLAAQQAAESLASMVQPEAGPSVDDVAKLIGSVNPIGEQIPDAAPVPTVGNLVRTIVPFLTPRDD